MTRFDGSSGSMRSGIAAEVAHRVAHGDEVDDRGHAREVLMEDARGREAQLARWLVCGHPAGHRLHVGLRAGAQCVLEQDAQSERQARDVVASPEAASRRKISYSVPPTVSDEEAAAM